MKQLFAGLGLAGFLIVAPPPVGASAFFLSTGNPDGQIATLSRPAAAGVLETETADDFFLNAPTNIAQASFFGLLPLGTPLSNISEVGIEFYHVFPADSTSPPDGRVPTRMNSPSDVEIAAATRDSSSGTLSFTSTLINSRFTVANTVVNGIHASPNQFTGGEGSATGEEVLISVTFVTPVDLTAAHYFFRPEVGLAGTSDDFLWLSAPKPIVAPGTPFTPDLQTWIRNSDLAPDWLRIGTDITHQGPFNAAFSLSGVSGVPEPGTLALLVIGLAGVGRVASGLGPPASGSRRGPRSCGARGRSRTDTLFRAADFRATSAFAAPARRASRVRGLEHAFTMAMQAVGARRLLSTPSLRGWHRAWLGVSSSG